MWHRLFVATNLLRRGYRLNFIHTHSFYRNGSYYRPILVGRNGVTVCARWTSLAIDSNIAVNTRCYSPNPSILMQNKYHMIGLIVDVS